MCLLLWDRDGLDRRTPGHHLDRTAFRKIVKLPARWLFHIVPLDPALKGGACGARAGRTLLPS